MKKILILILLITALGVNSNIYSADVNMDNPGVTVDMDNQGNTENMFQSQMDGYTSNIDAQQTDGPQKQPTFEEFDKNNSSLVGSFDSSKSNTGVPKLSLKGIVFWLADIMQKLVYLILAASLVVFLFGILKLSFIDGQKPESREQARKFMFWGIVSLFIMVSVWGLVQILQMTFFNNNNLIIPQLK